MEPTLESIVKAVRQSVAARDSARDALGERIRTTVADVLDACACEEVTVGEREASITLRRVDLVADCSQWGNRMDHPGHREIHLAALVRGDTRSLGAVPDLGFFDGSNMQHQQGPARDVNGARVRPATVGTLRVLARELPPVLARLLAERRAKCDAEARSAIETAEQLAQTCAI
jgi:hypothetical protein